VQQDLVSETFQLRYVRPTSTYVPYIQSAYIDDLRNRQPMQPGQTMFTLIDTLKKMLTPEIGTLDYVNEQNFVVVKDTRPVIENIRRTLDLIDTEPQQIQLDIRFVTTTNEDVLDVGINPGGSGWTASLGLGQIPTNLPFNLGQGGWDDRIIANPTGDNSGQGRGRNWSRRPRSSRSTIRRRRSSSARRSATPKPASSRARPVVCCSPSRKATSRR
jgi:type II secretory pathway component GspD/PulD (secretin)